MTTQKQLTANRVNAKRSTGPKSAGGKARSRQNAWKHGLTAKSIVICDEEPKDLEARRAELVAYYNPWSPLQFWHIERLAVIAWRLGRVPWLEAQLIEARCAEAVKFKRGTWSGFNGNMDQAEENYGSDIGLALIKDGVNQDALGKLARYETSLMNAFNRTLQQFLFLQEREAQQDGSHAIVVDATAIAADVAEEPDPTSGSGIAA